MNVHFCQEIKRPYDLNQSTIKTYKKLRIFIDLQEQELKRNSIEYCSSRQ